MDTFTSDRSMFCTARRERRAARFWALGRQGLLGFSLAMACQSALAQAMYRIKPLGFLGGCTSSVPTVAGLNGKDEVAGTACNAHGDMHAFLWKNNGAPMVDLGPDGIGSYSYARAINASGLVAGDMADHPDGLGDQFAFESSGDGTPARRIPNNTDTLPIRTVAMNNQGQLTGSFGNSGTTAWFWTPDGTPDGKLIRDMGNLGGENSTGRSINDAGQVAGYSDPAPPERPVPSSGKMAERRCASSEISVATTVTLISLTAPGRSPGSVTCSGNTENPRIFLEE